MDIKNTLSTKERQHTQIVHLLQEEQCGSNGQLICHSTHGRAGFSIGRSNSFSYIRTEWGPQENGDLQGERERTVFLSQKEMFQVVHVLLELKRGLSTFEREINFMISTIQWQLQLVYRENIVIYLKSQIHIQNTHNLCWSYCTMSGHHPVGQISAAPFYWTTPLTPSTQDRCRYRPLLSTRLATWRFLRPSRDYGFLCDCANSSDVSCRILCRPLVLLNRKVRHDWLT